MNAHVFSSCSPASGARAGRRSRPGPFLTLAAVVFGLLLTACDYDVPLSAKPDRPVDEAVLGNWISPDGWMSVRRFDADHYVVFHNGTLYRGWHSQVAGRTYVNLCSLDAQYPKFAYLTYQLGAQGRRLDIRFVRDEVIPKTITSADAIRRALEEHAADPHLLSDPVPFTRTK